MSPFLWPLLLALITFPTFGQWQGFAIDQTISTSTPVYQIAIGRTDGDVYADIIALQTDRFNEVSVFSGHPSHQFSFARSFTKQENYRVVEVGDLNADGVDDIVISGYWNNGLQIFWGSKSGEYTPGSQYALTGHGKNVKIADINKDGANDIIALSGGSGQPITFHLFIGGNNKTFILKTIVRSQLDTDKRIQIVDKNQDGLLDVMVASSFPWFVIFYQDANGSFTPRYWPGKLAFPFTSEYYLEDLDNDHWQDILAFYEEEGFRIYKGKQDTTFEESYKSIRIDHQPSRIFTSDIDNDGNKDIVFGAYDEDFEPTNKLYFMLGKGNMEFAAADSIELPGQVDRFILADYNDDSYVDIVSYIRNVGMVTVRNKTVLTAVDERDVSLRVYPNPFSNFLYVARQNNDMIEVTDIAGKVIRRLGLNEQEINTANWSSGIYFIKSISGKEVAVRRVVKK